MDSFFILFRILLGGVFLQRIVTTSIISMVLLLVILPISTGAENRKEKINEEIIYDVLVDRINNGNPELGEQVDIDDDIAYHCGVTEGVYYRFAVLDLLGSTTLLST